MTKRVNWKRSDEGFVDSKCGQYRIEPVFCHRTAPIGYTLIAEGGRRLGRRDTITECKTLAERKAEQAVSIIVEVK